MTCNNKHDIPEYVGAMAEVNDTFKDIIFKQANAEGKFLKLGSALNVLQAGVHAKHGEWENFFSRHRSLGCNRCSVSCYSTYGHSCNHWDCGTIFWFWIEFELYD